MLIVPLIPFSLDLRYEAHRPDDLPELLLAVVALYLLLVGQGDFCVDDPGDPRVAQGGLGIVALRRRVAAHACEEVYRKSMMYD